MEHIWTMLMHKILQNHLLHAFVVNLKIGTIYALYLESFSDKNPLFLTLNSWESEEKCYKQTDSAHFS